jgi:hypothetical protein
VVSQAQNHSASSRSRIPVLLMISINWQDDNEGENHSASSDAGQNQFGGRGEGYANLVLKVTAPRRRAPDAGPARAGPARLVLNQAALQPVPPPPTICRLVTRRTGPAQPDSVLRSGSPRPPQWGFRSVPLEPSPMLLTALRAGGGGGRKGREGGR